MSKKKISNFDFEDSLNELNELVTQLENGNLSLEKSLQQFEKGIKIIKECQQGLTKAEQKIQILTQKGKEALANFSGPEKDD